ncbi:hypothetical protein SLEP1_g38437 [Rubroshorea leprosula]|nr:hypothetical protein SLEP1_g38437 [Rubroshorea leprosula]
MKIPIHGELKSKPPLRCPKALPPATETLRLPWMVPLRQAKYRFLKQQQNPPSSCDGEKVVRLTFDTRIQAERGRWRHQWESDGKDLSGEASPVVRRGDKKRKETTGMGNGSQSEKRLEEEDCGFCLVVNERRAYDGRGLSGGEKGRLLTGKKRRRKRLGGH